jgi:nucleoside-diphosphate-sugar epimerase
LIEQNEISLTLKFKSRKTIYHSNHWKCSPILKMADEPTVLVTGGSGFVGSHCIIACLAKGYHVRTTVRSLNREPDVRKLLEQGKATSLDKLTFFEADLTKDAGWKEATTGCNYVLHVASPFPAGAPKHEDDLIIPAREGTLRVLRAARDAGVKRVVVTSSVAAAHSGKNSNEPSTEAAWTDVDSPDTNAYSKSKTLAEKAAWDFIEAEGGAMELAVVNPVTVFGPYLGQFSGDITTSLIIVQRLMRGDFPACPQLTFAVVDVRDVADLHLRAMLDPKAKGERFIAVAPPSMSIQDMSLALRNRMGKAARKCPTMRLPNIALRLVGLFDPSVALVLIELGILKL